jgi:plastocyanin
MSRSAFLRGALVAAALALCTGTLASAAGAAAPNEVRIDNFSFVPQALTLAAGTTVTWVNRDDIPHTVVSTATPPVFKSKPLDTDDRFSFKFEKPGIYPYFCSLHPKMTGTVTVR